MLHGFSKLWILSEGFLKPSFLFSSIFCHVLFWIFVCNQRFFWICHVSCTYPFSAPTHKFEYKKRKTYKSVMARKKCSERSTSKQNESVFNFIVILKQFFILSHINALSAFLLFQISTKSMTHKKLSQKAAKLQIGIFISISAETCNKNRTFTIFNQTEKV